MKAVHLTDDQVYLLSMAARQIFMKKRGCNPCMSRRPALEKLDVGTFLVWRNEIGYEVARFKVIKNLKVVMV